MARGRYLPQEVLEEIMLWLPPESLRRFKVVQKSWYLQISALMNDPVFVAKHLRNMKELMLSTPAYHYRYLMAVRVEGPADEAGDEDIVIGNHLLLLANDYYSGRDYIPCYTDDRRKLMDYQDRLHFHVAYQCDGVVCLSDFNEGTVYLLNPALREMKIIHCSCRGNDYELRGVGFGYDAIASEYKLVAFMAIPLNEEVDVEGSNKAEVYSLRANSWKELGCNIKTCKFDGEYGGQVYCDGACYWYYCDFVVIMYSFDFSDEVFRSVPLPVRLTMPEGYWLDLEDWIKITVWKDSLVLFVYPADGPKVMDMWVLSSKPGSNEGSYSWTKHVTIGPLDGIKSPLGFWDDVELFLIAEDGKIKFYHLDYKTVSHNSKNLEWIRDDRILIYQKSLVSVLRKE